MAIRDGRLFYVTIRELFSSPINSDGSLGAEARIAGDLPDAGQHPNRTIAFGPDGLLYISVGSTCNDCEENNPENATLIRMKVDGTGREIVASGMRNTIASRGNLEQAPCTVLIMASIRLATMSSRKN